MSDTVRFGRGEAYEYAEALKHLFRFKEQAEKTAQKQFHNDTRILFDKREYALIAASLRFPFTKLLADQIIDHYTKLGDNEVAQAMTHCYVAEFGESPRLPKHMTQKDAKSVFDYKVYNGEKVCLLKYKNKDMNANSCLQIPSVIDKLPVVEIGYKCFEGLKCDEVLVPHSIRQISSEAFAGSEIKTLKMAEGVKTLGHSVFQDCKKLETVEFSNTLCSISTNTLAGCESLKMVVLPRDCTSIGAFAFPLHFKNADILIVAPNEKVRDYILRRGEHLGSIHEQMIVVDKKGDCPLGVI